MNNEILPIGTVVITKSGNIPLMIVSRAALFEENGEIGYLDYSAIPYPMGITDAKEFAFFNHEDIESIIYIGYINSDEQLFSNDYNKLVEESGYKKITLQNK
ncbi:DUF4176 domain-containing protein [Streptococcus plurextorum]|uniref:DUF4176 domain-containing protein n=1 Tax=Streptococcus plurextorum TaxID=456876 RepID=UPI00056132DB|nr:DUF4176 domain-containing protein [Streptococcus plurextorum]